MTTALCATLKKEFQRSRARRKLIIIIIAIITLLNCFTDSCEFASPKYYALCGLGGILSCGITHTMVTPLDLVKCRLQVDPAKYKNVVNGFKVSRVNCRYNVYKPIPPGSALYVYVYL